MRVLKGCTARLCSRLGAKSTLSLEASSCKHPSRALPRAHSSVRACLTAGLRTPLPGRPARQPPAMLGSRLRCWAALAAAAALQAVSRAARLFACPAVSCFLLLRVPGLQQNMGIDVIITHAHANPSTQLSCRPASRPNEMFLQGAPVASSASCCLPNSAALLLSRVDTAQSSSVLRWCMRTLAGKAGSRAAALPGCASWNTNCTMHRL